MDKNNLSMECIKAQFDQLKDIRLQIKQSIGKIDEIKAVIKENYKQYMQHETQDYFGLDSFHFQNKAIELEHKNMLKLYHFIDNRIYGDYYKLFSMIVSNLNEQLQENQIVKMKELTHLKQYPTYKDLEPFKKYDFDLINQIHQDIIIVLDNAKEIYQENTLNIEQHKKQLDLGMNIDNYVINQEYMNNNLQMTNHLHENYLNVFHKYHSDWLKKYFQKIRLFHEQIRHHKHSHSIKKENDDVLVIQMKQPVSPVNESDSSVDNEDILNLCQEEHIEIKNEVISSGIYETNEDISSVICETNDISLSSIESQNNESEDGFKLVTRKKRKRNKKGKRTSSL